MRSRFTCLCVSSLIGFGSRSQSVVTLSSFDESPKSSFPDDIIALLSLTLLEPPSRCFLSPTFSSERGSAAGEDRHARGHHRPQNGTGEDF